ncbi:hypothetical protein [uncultured Shimia sp.]|uniref:hypothetical protein n=1 Tax=uncultured Shimia sp. TaxID=573152 RepID=UPI00262374DF|nr:hypothetical protein [uncultured Shimia sp.]
MPVSFRILKSHGLTYVRYEGVATLDETLAAFAEFAQHPDCRPGLKQLVDLTAVQEVKFDFPKLMEMQAKKADVFMAGPAETLIVYLTNASKTSNMAHMILRSWEPFPSVVPRVIEDEAAALSILGLREDSIEALLATAA